MDDLNAKAAAVLVRCRGYSRNMADNCLATLTADEIASLASVAVPLVVDGKLREYVVRDGCGDYVALVMDEIADRKALDEAEKRHQEKPLDQAPAVECHHRREALADSRQRRAAAELPPLPSPAVADDGDDDEPAPDDPTEIAEEIPG